MPSVKRKRDGSTNKKPANENDPSTALDAFRRHFESQFGVVEGLTPPVTIKNSEEKLDALSQTDDSDDDDAYEDWNGIGNDDDDGPEVIEYHDLSKRTEPAPLVSRREFMSSKPPRMTAKKEKTSKKDGSDDENDRENLANDLELQRLLNESHLLDPTTLSHSTGRNRHIATELRISSSLGGKALGKLDGTDSKIPMHIRKGMAAKKVDREVKRRREARDAGIVLEKQIKVKKVRKRDSGVGGPSVGKFKGGQLLLSKRDVEGIIGKPKVKKKGKR